MQVGKAGATEGAQTDPGVSGTVSRLPFQPRIPCGMWRSVSLSDHWEVYRGSARRLLSSAVMVGEESGLQFWPRLPSRRAQRGVLGTRASSASHPRNQQ